MKRLRAWMVRLGGMFRRGRDEALAVEMQSHLELHIADNLKRGMTPEEARREALMKLGGVEQTKEAYRERRGLPALDALAQDIRFGARMLRKNAGFAAVVILTLALGIGANSAIFTLTYAVILKSLPVPNPGELVRYTFRSGAQDLGLSGPVYDALRAKETANSDVLAWSGAEFAVEENGVLSRVQGALLSGNGFRVLELQPIIGRAFSEEHDVTGGGANGYQALLGYQYWKEHFQKNSSVIGQTLTINKRVATVIGVLPQGFEGLIAGQPADIVLPLAFEEVLHTQPMRHHAGSFWLTVMGRLRPGETLRSAEANLRATESAVREEADPNHHFLGGFFASFHIGVESGRSGRSFLKVAYSQPLVVLEILVGMLLVLCGANTALLVLARVSSRDPEFAVRSALGAARGRLVQQVLCEVGLLAVCGLIAGVGLGWAAARTLTAMMASVGPSLTLDVTPRAAILWFTAAVSLLAALAAGMWPALRASRVAPAPGLKQADARSSARHLGNWTVPAQVAVSLTLLAAASLLSSAFMRLLLEDSGFRTGGVTLAEVDLSAAKLPAAQVTQDAKQILSAVEGAPGVAAAIFNTPPLHDWWSAGHYFSVDGHGAVHSDMQTWPESVSPGFFAALGTRLLDGREFSRADETGERVCVLSASAAEYFFPGETPVGKFIYAGGEDSNLDGKVKIDPSDTCRVVGVAENARFRSLREAAPRMLYRPIGRDDLVSGFFLAVRGASSANATSVIRDAVRAVIPTAIPPDVYSFDHLVGIHLQRERMLMALSAGFAAIALLLTSVGLYGVLARSVVMRRKEIGVRLALGARPRDAMVLVVWQGMRLVLVGAVVGLAVTVGVTRVLRNLLFGLRGIDLLTLAGSVAVLLFVAVAASYLPARRAMKVDPLVALRYE